MLVPLWKMTRKILTGCLQVGEHCRIIRDDHPQLPQHQLQLLLQACIGLKAAQRLEFDMDQRFRRVFTVAHPLHLDDLAFVIAP